jgi:hypothetical protein
MPGNAPAIKKVAARPKPGTRKPGIKSRGKEDDMKHGRKDGWTKAAWLRYRTWHGVYWAASVWPFARLQVCDDDRED